jgi:hypothetical protein
MRSILIFNYEFFEKIQGESLELLDLLHPIDDEITIEELQKLFDVPDK